MAQSSRSHERDALAAIPGFDRLAHRPAKFVTALGGRLVRRIISIHHHRHHGQSTARQHPAVKKTKGVADSDFRPELVAARDVEFSVGQRANQMLRQSRFGFILGGGWRPTPFFGVLPGRRIAAGVGHHWQRFAVINGERRHVVFVKLLMLIIAEHDDNIGLAFFERIAQDLDRREAGLVALTELFLREFGFDLRLCFSQQGPVIQPRVSLVLFPENPPIGRPHAQLRAMGGADTDDDLCHKSLTGLPRRRR